MNRDRIEALRDYLLGVPDEKFDMTKWFRAPNGSYAEEAEEDPSGFLHGCGTAACIAGHAVVAFNLNVLSFGDVGDCAASYLDLDILEQLDLFQPEGFSEGVYTRQDAIAVLNRFLETGEIQWPN